IGERQVRPHRPLALARLLRILIGHIRLHVDGVVLAAFARLFLVGLDRGRFVFFAFGLIVGVALVLARLLGRFLLAFGLVDILLGKLEARENVAREFREAPLVADLVFQL